MNGEGSYEHHERKVVYSVVSSAECKHVLSAIKEVDPKAFVNVIKTEQISGHLYQRHTNNPYQDNKRGRNRMVCVLFFISHNFYMILGNSSFTVG